MTAMELFIFDRVPKLFVMMTASHGSSVRMNNTHIIHICLFLRLYCKVLVVNSENTDEMHQQQTKTFNDIIEKHL